ncbi:uncharacterized protein LOC114049015 [Vombatus ursinus]|uniref:uncharacterized protein LOC114049015 n=1 Tax=Vombatus ursinus TaxID=29139 RepID=UPI000FFCEFD8|nr:uncharacterized protein LOC114049015 [Vombatus ursinus]
MLGPQIDRKLLEQVEAEGLRSETMEKRSRRVLSLQKRPLEGLGSGMKLADRTNLKKRIAFQPWTPSTTIFSPLQTVKQNVPLQERESSGEQPLGTRETDPASFLSPGTILSLKDPPNLEGLKKLKEKQEFLPSGRQVLEQEEKVSGGEERKKGRRTTPTALGLSLQLGGSPWKKCDGALQWDLLRLNPDKRKILEDVASPDPYNLVGAQCSKLSGCLEPEATFYQSNSSEILLPTSPEGQTGLSLHVPSSSAAFPKAQGLSLEPRAKHLSSLSGNPSEKLPNKIILPRRTPSFKLQRKTGPLERTTQDFMRPPAPGRAIGPGTVDETARAPNLSTEEKEKL